VTTTAQALPEPAEAELRKKTFKDHAHWLWREWIKPLLVVGLVLGSFRSAIADWNDVPSGSMKPTILEGDRVFVNKIAYDLKIPFTTWRVGEWSNPQRGDVVVLYSPADGRRLIKRVVGLPGDKVEMKDNRLIVNGVPAAYEPLPSSAFAGIDPGVSAFEEKAHEARPHPILTNATHPSYEPTTLAEARYFVMGDNRDNSYDSRYFGSVERTQILGRATAVVLSVNITRPWWQLWEWQPRWGRFFTRLR
jgi:signal peptidase I